MQMRDTELVHYFQEKNSLRQQLLITREELHLRTTLLLFFKKKRLYMEVQRHGDSQFSFVQQAEVWTYCQ